MTHDIQRSRSQFALVWFRHLFTLTLRRTHCFPLSFKGEENKKIHPYHMKYLQSLIGKGCFDEALTCIVNDLANNRFPQLGNAMTALRVIRCVALQKPGKDEARPFGIREVLANLVSAVQAREQASELVKSFGVWDLGFRAPDSTALLAHVIQARINGAKQANELWTQG